MYASGEKVVVPFVMRKLDKRSHWWPKNPEDLPWLKAGEPQGDAISELRTTKNTLSVWIIEDDQSNLDQVIGAIAATRDTFADIEYLLLDPKTLQRNGFKLEPTEGDSPDTICNTKYHRDIVELSAGKLLKLTELIYRLKGRGSGRRRGKEIERQLRESFSKGTYDKARMKKSMLEKLEGD